MQTIQHVSIHEGHLAGIFLGLEKVQYHGNQESRIWSQFQ
jgi:hypothetical protein